MFARSNAPRFFDAVLAACREAGFGMNIAHEVDNLYTACALVAAGLGVCLVPAGVRDSHVSSPMVVRPVTPEFPHTDMHIALAYKPNSTNGLVPLFVEVVERSGRETKPTKRALRVGSDGGICFGSPSVPLTQKSSCALILKKRPTVIDSGFRYV